MQVATVFNRDTALNCVRELLEANSRLSGHRSRLTGDVKLSRIAISYRTSWVFVPPFKVTTFLGKVIEARDGSVIQGRFAIGPFMWVWIAAFAASAIASIGRQALLGDYGSLAIAGLICIAIFIALCTFIATANQYVIDELCRATRGSAA